MSLLMRGLHGEPVRILQNKLGINADGVFGSATEAALKDYQSKNGLQVDGIAGPDTFTQMGLYELVLLKVGTRGAAVKKLQEALGVGADGAFGHGTEAAVKKFQESKGLEVDGEAGPKTLAQVPGFEITEEQVAASVVTENTPQVDPAAVEQAKTEDPPPQGIVAKVEEKVAAVGSSIWNTIKKIF